MKDGRICPPDVEDPWDRAHPRDAWIQIILSVGLGLVAFLIFCVCIPECCMAGLLTSYKVLRPRWKGLYAARKKQVGNHTSLADLPDSLFGWILPLWRITEEDVLASAGLDAYVYLAFFKMAIKFLVVALFFALAIIKPVHDTHKEPRNPAKPPGNDTKLLSGRSAWTAFGPDYEYHTDSQYYTDYLWMYIVFAYLFTGLLLYLIVSETRRIIEVRQEYLGSQTTITDRTIRLSGIPENLRSEDRIKDFIEDLVIGNVESVTLCRNWKELDDRLIQRKSILRKLEEAWTVYLGKRRVERSLETLPIVQPRPPGPEVGIDSDDDDNEASQLLNDTDRDPDYSIPYAQQRPMAKIWMGRFKLRFKNVDAINYYEEKLRRLDDEITALRKKDFEPTPLAFITLDSVASAQMAIQAVLDPSPLQLLANSSPAPSDVVWSNTYLPRSKRMLRSWSITIIIGILSIFWTALLVPIAGALNICSIHEVFPGLANALSSHELLKSLVNTQLPTVALTLLNVGVPYLYDWLANQQGMISQGDVELSVISKNFFFTFFNFFILFTILGTTSNLVDMLERFGKELSNATTIANVIAESLQNLLPFYTNFIILQGFGLFPLRLLEFGTLTLYPINLMGAKTPRDYAELVQPPIFSYGFFLPQTILIFIICVVYSVLLDSWKVLLTGLAYFMIGHFVHKYQLLYAMEHRQHSTGRGWMMMCDRVIVGVVLFQITMAGQLALKNAFKRAALITPLIFGTIWFGYVYSRTYRPLMKFIALRSLRNSEHSDLGRAVQEDSFSLSHNPWAPSGLETLDEARERGLRFESPSLMMPKHEQNTCIQQMFGRLALPNGGATITSSQIYLSRGVAGTKSTRTLPFNNITTPSVVSFSELSHGNSFSLGPPVRSSVEVMSCYFKPTAYSEQVIDELRQYTPTVEEPCSMVPTKAFPIDPLASSMKRVEVLQHVLQRPSRDGSLIHRRPSSRVATPVQRKRPHSSTTYARSRVAFHKVISSIFTNNSTKIPPPLTREGSEFSVLSTRGSLQDSLRSLDVVSPGTFLFSGPSLRSTYSGSLGNSRSRLQSLSEYDKEVFSLRRVRSTSLSIESFSLIENRVLEPSIEWGITRTMSDVLQGFSTPIDELNDILFEDPSKETSEAIAPLKFPPSYRIPVEILQHIYKYLNSKDFNSARHTCRSWMRASLSKKLLVPMLNRGGWWSSARDTLERRKGQAPDNISHLGSNEEWLLSRYLSRECALSAPWTGNGLSPPPHRCFVEIAETEFSELANGHSGSRSQIHAALLFVTSTCGSILLVARDTIIYIYDLCTSVIQPLTSVTCPRRVLSMSMNITSGRNAIAALLEGRLGMVCELRFDDTYGTQGSVKVQSQTGPSCPTTSKSSVIASRIYESNKSTNPADHSTAITHRFTDQYIWPSFNSVDIRSNYDAISLQRTDDKRMHDHNWINHTWNPIVQGRHNDSTDAKVECPEACANCLPVQAGPSTFYRHLCSDDDPPRSVSICPQRRCVAFGCSAGIELHWIDALTGQSLTRWFPLTAPSDYLHFLPPRPGFESSKKLRLISSAAHPDDRPTISHKFIRSLPGLRAFWGSSGIGGYGDHPRVSTCDHYRAVPLSDGHHVLFIDPPTSGLFLGCDGPIDGPTKLLRKILLLPPAEKEIPHTYTAAADLSCGARIIAAYGDTIMLYKPNGDFSADRIPFWPITIRGTKIDEMHGVCELAVSTQPDIIIWGFSPQGRAKTWQVRKGAKPAHCQYKYVCRSGIVHLSHVVDESGEIATTTDDTIGLPPGKMNGLSPEQSVGFDGNSSELRNTCLPRTLSIEKNDWLDLLDVRGCDAWYDESGDVSWIGRSHKIPEVA
ncbi:hypothetical protein B0J11DRAFT_556914 [Dendryphion nanum]|uniref:F-box domain-containing protein n=1 Tax=Dendryphion nanum TaxID=256645 RepID=A0A9P9E7B2_9PLEO|nr:hypothetical protein B0J11DRAFT_556914 [Dendryphion nanum]